MTPAARWAAAAQILDEITSGTAAEKALTNWARRSRFAGSKDRAAIRDHVYDIVRCWRSTAALGGGTSGRHLVLGRLRQTGIDPDAVMSGQGYGLEPPTNAERVGGRTPEGADAADVPDWLHERITQDLGSDASEYFDAMKTRAPVFLRVNTLKTNVSEAQDVLFASGISTVTHPLSSNALQVTDGARRVAQSAAFASGLVELQDVASQAVVDALPLKKGHRVLDYCAGGGGKSLAMAARLNGPIEAHDADSRRMKDIPIRAERAGARVTCVTRPVGEYDLVLCDAPCSGSGAWRRSPEGKWRLSPEQLDKIRGSQAMILDKAEQFVKPDGFLVYATCSVLNSENEDQIDRFLEHQTVWTCLEKRRFSPTDGGDGFFLAILTRTESGNTL